MKMFVFAIVLSSASLFAQAPKTTFWTSGKVDFIGTTAEPPALTKIFSNLAASTTAAYSSGGYYDAGPLSALGGEQFVALPFTPTSNAHVEQLRAAIQYISGANQVTITLFNDVGGLPGKPIAAPITVTNLPTYPSCCQLAVATLHAPVAVTAGTQYWIVAATPATGTGSDFEGVWNWENPLPSNVGINAGSGFFAVPAYIQQSAGAVYGSIP